MNVEYEFKEFSTFADAVAEIEMLVKKGFKSFKLYRNPGCFWRVEFN